MGKRRSRLGMISSHLGGQRTLFRAAFQSSDLHVFEGPDVPRIDSYSAGDLWRISPSLSKLHASKCRPDEMRLHHQIVAMDEVSYDRLSIHSVLELDESRILRSGNQG